ncbi:MAG: ATP-binding protein [Halanaerobiales bacterium]
MIEELKSLRSKIYLGFFIVIILLIIVNLWSISNFGSLSEAINSIMVENYQSIKATENLVESVERQDSSLLMILDGEREDGQSTFRENEQEFYKWLGRAEDNVTIEGENEIIEEISDDYLNYINYFDEFLHLEEGKRDFYYQEILPLFYSVKEGIRDLRSINQETMVEAQQRADGRADSAVISTVIISILAVIAALGFGIYLSRIILRPIKDLKRAIRRVADKNFEHKLKIDSGDEIGELAGEYNKMISRLQEYEKLNIQKLVEEKEKSEAIVNNINSPLLVTDGENRLILLNQRAKKLFGLKQEDLDRHFLEVINNEQLFDIIKESRNNGQEKTITFERGESKIHFKVSCNTVESDEGDKKYTVTLLEDITKLKEIDEMKSEFVSTVSHEFRTPLTSMNMSLSMLLEGEIGSLNEDQKQLVEATYEDCERLNELVDDLLDLSKIESGKIQMDMDRVQVKKMVEATVRPFENQAAEDKINLTAEEIEDNLYMKADSNKISWVISNLIGNALRYTPEGGEIRVGARTRGQRVYIHVQDDGIGIPAEHQDKIFEKFYRANNNDDAASGTGLGLAIAREIIDAHGGSIWVESEEGEGAKFTFSVPCYRERPKKGEG